MLLFAFFLRYLCQTTTIIIWQEGQSNKHARRRPFSAVRASLALAVNGFASSRGALQDPHQERARNIKNPAAVGRRRAAASGPPPNGPRGRRPLVGGDRPHTAHHEKAPNMKERGETLQAKGTATRYTQTHYLSQIRRPRCRDYSGPSSQTTTEPTKMKIFESKATRPNSRFLSIFVGSVVVYDGER